MDLSTGALTIIAILLTIFVALVFFVLGLRRGRPNLVAGGSGSSTIGAPNQDVMGSYVNVRNQPTFFGIKVNRGSAKIQTARLYDPKLKKFVGRVLMWRKEGSNELERECTIDAGTRKTLWVFAKERHSDEFFIYSGKCLTSEYDKPVAIYKDRKKDFSIHLNDVIGHKYRFDITAHHKDQSVSISHKITWRARWRKIREAFGSLRRAFSPH